MKRTTFSLVLFVLVSLALSACGTTSAPVSQATVRMNVQLSADNAYIGSFEAVVNGTGYVKPSIEHGSWMYDAADNCVPVGDLTGGITFYARPDHHWELLYSRGGVDTYCLMPGQ